MNPDILFVRVRSPFGTTMVPIKDATLIQIDPNTGAITQEVPLTRPIEDLIEYNLSAFVKTHQDRKEWIDALEGRG
jgi:hypothetical protein